MYMDFLPLDFDKMLSYKVAKNLSREHFVALLFNCMTGLSQMHEMGLIHRDIKPANILLDADCQVHICDFGLSRGQAKKDRPKSPHVVSRGYRAPEIALVEQYDE